ncbi:MAG: glycosyltransferase [Actinomycetota bacterium]|nr:glycosyltransferase [Actinomycetota bacterium]
MRTPGPAASPAHPSNRWPSRDRSELVVLSHLRWTFVWQRPQHIVSRLASNRRTWFVEEPMAVEGLSAPRLRTEPHGHVCRVWLEVPGSELHVCFSDPRAASYAAELTALLGSHGDRTAWLYTPMAVSLAEALEPNVLVYDVMDDLASFKGAPPELTMRQRRALKRADVVFTGGRSLHRSVVQRRPEGTHCFPSGVDPDHYAPAVAMRRPRPRKVAGWVGVIDERLNLELVGDLAHALPDWRIEMVGPVVKIDPTGLPRARNITYPGPAKYADLPDVMAGFDVALMPFALNEATRSISPTKTLEYLASGLPVVSTRVPDVVTDFGELVDLQHDAAGFADACRRVARHSAAARAAKAEATMNWHHWDTIAERMERLIAEGAQNAAPAGDEVTA